MKLDQIKFLLLRWKYPFLITFFLKVLLWSLALYFNYQPGSEPLSMWIRWDSDWYLTIAQHWYPTEGKEALSIVFYPFYPLAIAFFNIFIHNFNISSIVTSTFFSFVASVAIFELALLDYQKKVALLAVWFLNIFPTSLFLQSAYPESLFLSLSMFCILAFRKNHFAKAGLFGTLASLTKINGILLIPFFIVEEKNSRKTLITIVTASVGFIAYLFINYFKFGDFFYFTKPLEQNWFKHFEFPWVGIKQLINMIKFNDPNFSAFFPEVIAIIFIFLMGIFVFFKVRKSYGVYMLANLLLITSTSFILSTPRYALILFPIYIAFAQIRNILLLVSFSIISLGFLIFYTLEFTKGGWAF